MAFSADGLFVVSMNRGPGEVLLWDVKGDKDEPRVIPTEGRLFRAVVSPDRRLLAVAYADRVQFLDVTTGEKLYKLQGHHAGDLWMRDL